MSEEMKDLDFRLALIPYIAELVTQEGEVDAVRELRLKALKQLSANLNYYKSLNYMDRLLYAIAYKKGRMIMDATSKTVIERILNPRAPHYNGNEFYPDEYCIPEEELICWSETSLKAPLNDAGFRRYQQLFCQIFPDEYARIGVC